MVKLLKNFWNNTVAPYFADEGLFLGLLALIMGFCFFVIFSPFLLLWALNELSKTLFEIGSKEKDL